MCARRFPCFRILCAVLSIGGAEVRGDASPPPTSLFASSELIDVTLTGPVSSTISDRKDREERAFVLRVNGMDHDLRVRMRGKSRSRRDICIFPPLRLRFQSAEGLFAGQRKIKMVTHCRNSDAGDVDLMEEYLAYRIFSLLTPDSFRVRPLHVTYVDSDGRLSKRGRQRYAFLIESEDELEARRGGRVIDTTQISLAQLDARHAALVYIFQYLIGNTDWSLVTAEGETECCHNGLTLGIGDRIRYVPYDFDLAGLVNARYARPDPGLHLRSVRVRRYRGFCTDAQLLRSVVDEVRSREEEIYGLVRGTPGLDEKRQVAAIDYLSDFFDEARGDGFVTELEKQCLQPGG